MTARPPRKDELLTRAKVGLIAGEIQRVDTAFRVEQFAASVVARFPELELKARIGRIATCLEGHLPREFRPGSERTAALAARPSRRGSLRR